MSRSGLLIMKYIWVNKWLDLLESESKLHSFWDKLKTRNMSLRNPLLSVSAPSYCFVDRCTEGWKTVSIIGDTALHCLKTTCSTMFALYISYINTLNRFWHPYIYIYIYIYIHVLFIGNTSSLWPPIKLIGKASNDLCMCFIPRIKMTIFNRE